MEKLDPFHDIQLIKDIDGRIIKRLHFLYDLIIKEWSEKSLSGLNKDPNYPDFDEELQQGNFEYYWQKSGEFRDDAEKCLKEILTNYVKKEDLDKLLETNISHFHSIPNKYVSEEKHLDEHSERLLRRIMSDLNKLGKWKVPNHLDNAEAEANAATLHMIEIARKTISEILNLQVQDDEILEKKIEKASDKQLKKLLKDMEYNRKKIFIITKDYGTDFGIFVGVEGVFSKDLYYKRYSYGDMRNVSTENFIDKKDSGVVRIPLKNVLLIEEF